MAIQLTVGDPIQVETDEQAIETFVSWFNAAPDHAVQGFEIPGIGEMRVQKRHVVRVVLY